MANHALHDAAPGDDLRKHDTDGLECWCQPELDMSGPAIVVIHRSLHEERQAKQ